MAPEQYEQIDQLIQMHVYGGIELHPNGRTKRMYPPYHTESELADRIEIFMLEEVIGQGGEVKLKTIGGSIGNKYFANFGDSKNTEVIAATRPLAVCLAALKYLNVPYDKECEEG